MDLSECLNIMNLDRWLIDFCKRPVNHDGVIRAQNLIKMGYIDKHYQGKSS